jgi:hypothetical protein
MPDSPVISGVADLPKFYFAEGAPFRLTLTIGAEFSMTGKFVSFGMRARSGTVRRVFGTDSGESNLTIAGQGITFNIATTDATVPAFASGWTLEDVQAKGETEYWVDISATEGSDVLLRLQGQADWVAPGSDIAESSAVVASPAIDVNITSGAVSASVAVIGGGGDLFGPASATDNAIARYDLTTGKQIQNSGITIADGASGTLAGSNSGDVTLAGTPDYLTIANQVITRSNVNLASHVTGTLPVANGGTGQTALSSIDAADFGSGAAVDNYILAADGSSGAAWESPAALGIVATNSSASLKDLALNPDALTGSLATSALNVTQTWNTTGNPTLLKGYVTNTASGSGAKLLDLGVGATTRLNLDASGHLCTNTADDYASFGFLNSARGIGYSSANEKMLMYANASGIVNAGVDSNGLFLPDGGNLSWSSSGWSSASDLFLSRAAAATIQLGVNHATTAIRQTIKGCNATTGNGGELVLRAGTGTGGAVGTQGVWLGVPSANALKQYDFNGANLGGFFNESLRGSLRFAGGSGGDVTLTSNSSNGNIEFTPNGTGRVKFGTFTTLTSHTASGYIEIKDAGGTTRRLAVIA